MILRTDRLIMRNWKESDFDAFCDMCADKEVMKYFPNTLDRDESLLLARKIKLSIEEKGWGLWAVEIPESCDFIGFVGLHVPKDNLPFSPCIEVAWRLAKQYWGFGYATESALAAVHFGFSVLKLTEIVAFTSAINTPSINVMKKIGMHNTGADFDHPEVPEASRLSRHMLYRISNPEGSVI